jgi:hypothetical protein
MTVAETKRMLDALPDDMQVFIYVDAVNCVPISERSDIELIMLETQQEARVFMIRPTPITDGTLWIDKTIVNN